MAVEQRGEVHAQKVVANDIVAQRWEIFVQIGHTLGVNLHGLYLAWFGNEILCEHTHCFNA